MNFIQNWKNTTMSKTFDTLEKRGHVRRYSDKVPPKELIDKALWQAWKTSPSKNNAMAYKIFVFGPEHKEIKEKIWNLCVKNNARTENDAVDRGENHIRRGTQANPYYEHIKLNPYLFAIHSQPREPNDWYKRRVAKGMFFDQAWPHHIEKIVDSIAVEVGLFCANLTTYLLEKNIDVSYNNCFVRDFKQWQDIGLNYTDYRCIFLMTAGYVGEYRRDHLKKTSPASWHKDVKPEFEEIIKWI